MRRHRARPSSEDGGGDPLLLCGRCAKHARNAGMEQLDPSIGARPVPRGIGDSCTAHGSRVISP